MKIPGSIFSSLLALSVLPLGSWADGYRNPPDGAKAMALTGGKVTLLKEAASMSHNPAALSGLESPELQLNAVFGYSKKSFTTPDGRRGETRNDIRFLPSLYWATPLEQEGLAAGIGISFPYGQSSEWGRDTPFRLGGSYEGRLTVMNVNPTVAWEVRPGLQVGAGLDVYLSDLKTKQIYPWGLALGGPFPEGEAEARGDGVGVGANIGLLWEPVDGHHFGLTWRSSVDVDYEGDFELSNVPGPAAAQGAVSRSDLDTEISYPSLVVLGYGVEVTETFRIGVDVEWIEFSVFDETRFDLGPNTPFLQPNPILSNWEDTWSVGVAAEKDVSEVWTIRGGVVFLDTPVPDRTITPSFADEKHPVFTLGTGYQKDATTIDVTLALGVFEDRTVSGNQNPLLNGEYGFDNALLSVSYRRMW